MSAKASGWKSARYVPEICSLKYGADGKPPSSKRRRISSAVSNGLSCRLTPWETIEKRLDCAAAADLTIALYNPASHGRPDHVKRACDILLRRLPEDRLCGIVRNIGRDGQSRRILTLAELREAEVDMFCTVFIGNSAAKTVAGQLITPRGYRNV